MSDLYAILKIPANASQSEIKAAYKRQALRVHPDKGGSSLEFQKVVAAFEQLADPLLRQAHDRRGAHVARPKPVPKARTVRSKAKAAKGFGPFGVRKSTKSSAKAKPKATPAPEKKDCSRAGSGSSGKPASWKQRLLAKVVKLLKALPAEDRRRIFTGQLVQAQRLELEAFMRSECGQPQDSVEATCVALAAPLALGDHEDEEDQDDQDDQESHQDHRSASDETKHGPLGPAPRKRKQIKPGRRRQKTHRLITGISSFTHWNRTFFRCQARAEWMTLKVTHVMTLEEAIDRHIILTGICERIRSSSSASMKDRILGAVEAVLPEHGGPLAEELKIVVEITVPAKHWIGRDILLSGFKLKDIDVLADIWHRIKDARGPVCKRAWFDITPPDDTWKRLRQVCVDFHATRGNSAAVEKLDHWFEELAPQRERKLSRWNCIMMRRAEQEQRRLQKSVESSFQRQMSWERQRMLLEDRLARRLCKQLRIERRRMLREDRLARRARKAHFEEARHRSRLDRLLTTWRRVHEADAKRAARRSKGKRPVGKKHPKRTACGSLRCTRKNIALIVRQTKC